MSTTYSIEQIKNKIICGDVLTELRKIPNESIDCVVTSPPYYAKRDYGEDTKTIWGGDPNCQHQWKINVSRGRTGSIFSKTSITVPSRLANEKVKNIESAFCQKCGAWYGQLGLEPTIDLYLDHIFQIMKELKRVLKKDGTFFLNLGDTYSGSHQGFGLRREVKEKENLVIYLKKYGHTIGKPPPNTKLRIRRKSLMGIPWRIAIAMIDDNWILRNDNVWFKINALPESVKDRFSVKHEYVFFFTKSQKYYFNLDAIREPLSESTLKRILGKWGKSKWSNTKNFSSVHYLNQPIEKYKNPKIHHQSGRGKTIIRDYFEKERKKYLNNFVGLNGQGGQLEFGGINSENSNYKEKLRKFAFQYFNKKDKFRWTKEMLTLFGKNPGDVWEMSTSKTKLMHYATFPEELVERCILCGCPEKGIVLDPFVGSGTTAVVAKRLKRNFIGIDIKPEYCEMARERLKSIS